MLNKIVSTAFSQHNRLPHRSIAFAVLFLIGFLVLNVYSFHQNSKRLQTIEVINRENLPSILAEIQDDIINLGHYSSLEGPLDDKQHESLQLLLEEIRVDMESLQNNQLAVVSTPEITKHFVGIYGTLDGLDDLLKKEGIGTVGAKAKFYNFVRAASEHFYAIDTFAQEFHQGKVEAALSSLRSQEMTLLSTGTAFVILGSAMIIFLLVDLFRRGELLEKSSQAERLKNSFFAMMSHEIRTPINGILGTVNMLNDTSLDPHQKHLTEIVQSSAESLLIIVNDVLDYSKIEAGKLELEYADFDLRKLLENVFDLVRPLAAAKKLEIGYELPGNISPALHSDPTRIRQILLNFLSNAVKFTEKGSVMVKIQSRPVTENRVFVQHLHFSVIDTGMGIGEEAKQHLFREFSQVDGSFARRFAGTGLGLAICRRLTEMMHGYIGVESKIGVGSTFWFSVPLVPAKGETTDCTLAKECTRHAECEGSVCLLIEDARPARVLLVEDNPTNRMIALAFLNQGRHRIDTAENGKEAVEAVKKNGYDVVLMDIAMPEMDGFAATRAIRAMGGDYKKLPIIAMTAHAMRGDREECLRNGMDDYITKPLSKDGLLQMVAKWTPQGAPASQQENPTPAVLPVQKIESAVEPEISEPHLQQIITDLGMENIGGFSKIFYSDLVETGGAMLEAETKQDWANLKTHAHSLKSSSMSFGLIRLSRFAATIEMECKAHGRPNPALLKEWPPRASSAIAALNARFKEMNIEPVD